MADNFNMKQFLAENKLGPYARNTVKNLLDEAETSNLKTEKNIITESSIFYQLMDSVDDIFEPGTDKNEKLKDAVEDAFNSGDIDFEELRHSPSAFNRVVKSIASEIGLSENINPIQEISIDSINRMEGLVNLSDMTLFVETVNSIADELLDEGFEYPEIKEFLQMHLDEILGK